MKLLPVLLAVLTAPAFGQPLDLGFEDSLISPSPGFGHWQVFGDDYLHYRAEVIPDTSVQGRRALLITARKSLLEEEIKNPATGIISQAFDATPYRGKRIRYSTFTRRNAGDGEAELLLLIHRGNDGAYTRNKQFDPSSSKWKQYELIADIPASATELVIRLQTLDDCSILFDSVAFEVVDKSVRTEREERAYYRMVEFYEGFTQRWVYEGEIRQISGSSLGGTIVMKNGVQYRYNRLPQTLIDRVNKKYRDELGK